MFRLVLVLAIGVTLVYVTNGARERCMRKGDYTPCSDSSMVCVKGSSTVCGPGDPYRKCVCKPRIKGCWDLLMDSSACRYNELCVKGRKNKACTKPASSRCRCMADETSQSCTKVLRDGKTQFIPVGLRNVVTDDGCNYCSCVDVGIGRPQLNCRAVYGACLGFSLLG